MRIMNEYLILLEPARPTFPADGTPEEFAIVGAHFAYLEGKLAAGEVILVGRTQDEHPIGLCVFEAPDDLAAGKFLADDPAIHAGIFVGKVRPYRVALMRGR